MATNGIHIARLAREHVVSALPRYDRGPSRIDEDGLARDTARWLLSEHADVVEADTRLLVQDTVTRVVKEALRASRPAASMIAAQAANPQRQFPSFEEVSREIYRDGGGVAIALIEMRKRAVYDALGAYDKLGAEVYLKRDRLAAIYAEMERRGLADDDTVRRLYEVAV